MEFIITAFNLIIMGHIISIVYYVATIMIIKHIRVFVKLVKFISFLSFTDHIFIIIINTKHNHQGSFRIVMPLVLFLVPILSLLHIERLHLHNLLSTIIITTM